MENTLRPLSTSEILDKTFQLYRNNFLVFAGIAALPPALLLIVQLLFVAAVTFGILKGGSLLNQPGVMVAGIVGAILGGLVFFGVYVVGLAMATGASVFAVSRAYLGNKVDIVSSYKSVLPFLGRILGIVFLPAIVIGSGSVIILISFIALGSGLANSLGSSVPVILGGVILGLAFFVALIYVGCRIQLSVAAAVIENKGVIDSIRRSWNLANGSVLRIFLILLLGGLLAVGLSFVLNLPAVILGAVAAGKALILSQVWQFIAGFVAGAIAGPIPHIATCLIYYDQRVRKEAFDLQLMMDSMGQAPPPPSVSSAASIG